MPTCGRRREQASLMTEACLRFQEVRDSSFVFIGIDLAWSRRNPSGGAVIRDGALLVSTGDLGSDEEIVDFIRQWLPDGAAAVIGVDAPLRVPNQTGSRDCDRELSTDWRRFEAGALPANRRLLENQGGVRGENLVSMLRTCCGVDECAGVPRRTERRIVCEVYPHPAHISLFGLSKTLKYKARKGRTVAYRRCELERYQNYLLSLAIGDPPLSGGLNDLPATDLHLLRGRALKAHEDRLDAITCAYIAWYLWHHGPERTHVYGDLESGHILVPMTSDISLPDYRREKTVGRENREIGRRGVQAG